MQAGSTLDAGHSTPLIRLIPRRVPALPAGRGQGGGPGRFRSFFGAYDSPDTPDTTPQAPDRRQPDASRFERPDCCC